MPVPQTGPIPYVDQILAILMQANMAVPMAFEAVRGILSLFRSSNPDLPLPTDEEVFAHLRQRAQEERASNEQWLRDHGYL